VSGLRERGFVKRVICMWEFGATSTCVVVEQAKDKEPRMKATIRGLELREMKKRMVAAEPKAEEKDESKEDNRE
jgi:hypothetical protein